MLSINEIRAIAMTLPEVVEGPPVRAARRIAAFKVAGKSFVGVEKGGMTITLSLPEKEGKAVAAEYPDACEEIWRNGKTFMGLRVDLSRMPARRVHELIERSWRHSAPTHVVAARDRRIPNAKGTPTNDEDRRSYHKT
ncbi:MAG TPA: MmcQ/YjbR family DNA-binding protein [Terriglobales bacterium]